MPPLDALHHVYQEYQDKGVDLYRHLNKPAILQTAPQNILEQKSLANKLLERIGSGVNNLADLLSGTAYAGDEAVAADLAHATLERVTIDEYYNSAKAVDEIVPGAKIGQYRVAITGLHNSFLNGLWNEYYFNDKSEEGQKIKSILREDSKINYEMFNQYFLKNPSTFKNVVIHSEGYLRFDSYAKDFKLIIPINRDTAKKLSNVKGVT